MKESKIASVHLCQAPKQRERGQTWHTRVLGAREILPKHPKAPTQVPGTLQEGKRPCQAPLLCQERPRQALGGAQVCLCTCTRDVRLGARKHRDTASCMLHTAASPMGCTALLGTCALREPGGFAHCAMYEHEGRVGAIPLMGAGSPAVLRV